MRKTLLLSCFMLFGILVQTIAQDRTVTGKVTSSSDGSVLPGVSVSIKGTNKGTTTDATGAYKIPVATNSKLVFTSVGFGSQEIAVGNRTTVDVKLEEDARQLNEVVIAGLATNVKRSNLANAVGVVSASQLTGTTTPITTDGALYGKVAGVNIQSNGSSPGGGFNVQLRGPATLGASSSQPLFIIDGVYIDNGQYSNGRSQANKATSGTNASTQDNNANRLADINPDDIETLEVLKGPSAAAIYGTRANAGVVIITTKRGKGGKTKISFGQDIGFGEAQNFFGGADWTEQKLTDYFDAADIPKLKDAKATGRYTDWERVIYGEKGAIRNTRLSITGGDDKTKFYINGSLNDEKGIVAKTGFTRASIRANIDHKVTKWADVGVSANYVYTNNDRGWAGNDNSNINYGYGIPYTKPYTWLYPNEQGVYPDNTPDVGENPLAVRDRAINNQKVNRFIMGFYTNIRFFNNDVNSLTMKLNAGIDYQNQYGLIYLPADLQSQRSEANPGFAQDNRTEVSNYNWQAALVYTHSLMDGRLNLTTSAGVTRLGNDTRINWVRGRGLPIGISNASAAKTFDPGVVYRSNTDVGIFAQQEANYEDKVIAMVGVRFDKSNLIGEFDKYFAFPRASVAFNIHKIAEFEPQTISQLKVRVAYGSTAGVPNFGIPFTAMNTTGIGGQGGLTSGTTIGNTKIKPETATEIEGGFDLGLFNNRVTLEATYYYKKIFDLIQPITLASTTGVTSSQTNLADMTNQGMELSLGIDAVRGKNFSWFIQPIFWYNRSEITRLDIPERLTGGFGSPFGNWLIRQGVSPTMIVDRPLTDPANPTSFSFYGDQQPKFELSLNQKITFLKNFEFSALFHWRNKFTVVSLARELWDEGGNTSDWNSTSLGYNAKGKPATGSEPVVPNGLARQNASGPGLENYQPQVASYLKLREVALYYRLPKATLKQVFGDVVQNVKIGFSGNNVLQWTDYKSGYDPENSNFGSGALGSGLDIGSIPAVRRLMFHIAVDF